MKAALCEPEHTENLKWYLPAINTAICDDCKPKYLQKGVEFVSIPLMSNSYLCDIRSIKNRFSQIYDEICSKEAKIQFIFEKQIYGFSAAFDAYVLEINKIKESVLEETKLEQNKFLNSYNVDITKLKEEIQVQENELNDLIIQLDSASKEMNNHTLISLIGSLDIQVKAEECEALQTKINPLLYKDPVVPYVLNRRDWTREEILSQIELSRPYENLIELINIPKDQPSENINPPGRYIQSNASLSSSPQVNNPVPINQIQKKKAFNNYSILHYFQVSKLILYDLSADKKYVINVPNPNIFPDKDFSTILIQEGIFLCGGSSPSVMSLKTSYYFDFSTLEFIQKKSMMNSRSKHSLSSIDQSMIYTLGGIRNSNILSECSKYNIELDNWIEGPYLNFEVCLLCSITVQNQFIYTFGGMGFNSNGNNAFYSNIEKLDALNEVKGWQKLNVTTNGWTGRYGMNCCQLTDQYFVIFGGSNVTYLNQCFLFDGETESLLYISKMLTGAKFEYQQAAPVLFNDSVYSIDDEQNLHIFNIRSNLWDATKLNDWLKISTKNQVPQKPALGGFY